MPVGLLQLLPQREESWWKTGISLSGLCCPKTSASTERVIREEKEGEAEEGKEEEEEEEKEEEEEEWGHLSLQTSTLPPTIKFPSLKVYVAKRKTPATKWVTLGSSPCRQWYTAPTVLSLRASFVHKILEFQHNLRPVILSFFSHTWFRALLPKWIWKS